MGRAAQLTATLSHLLAAHVVRAASQCQGAQHFCKHSTRMIEFLIVGVLWGGPRTWADPVRPAGTGICGETIFCHMMALIGLLSHPGLSWCLGGGGYMFIGWGFGGREYPPPPKAKRGWGGLQRKN